MKLPTIHDLITNPKARENLNEAQLQDLINKLSKAARGWG